MIDGLGFKRSWPLVAFCASAGAAAIHLAVARSHFMEWGPAGAFMLTSGLLQLAWAFWIVRSPSDQAVVAGVALNVGVIALWLVSRTTGIPLGPSAGMAEHIHSADALCTALELGCVASALAIGSRKLPSRVLVGLVVFASAHAVFASAHDPAREGLTAGAALALALAGRFVIVSMPRGLGGRRRDVRASLARSHRLVRLGGSGRPVFGTGRPAQSP